jgi:uncharacterized protein (DUF1015 family)
MTRIRPFRALRYDPARVDLGRVLVPPYDVIAAEDRVRLYERDPHCAIRLELTRDAADEATTDYAWVREQLESWTREGVLVRDARPALYGLRQTFRTESGAIARRTGFFALLHLEDYAARIVRPHERTLAGPKADRLKILRASKANLSSVFLLYEDPRNELAAAIDEVGARPIADATDEAGTEQRLWAIEASARIAAIERFLAARPLVIADGHHRYETALAYRDACRSANPSSADAPYEWLLVYLANAFAPGTLLLPIHRLVRSAPAPSDAVWRAKLPGWREQRVAIEKAEDVPAALAAELAPHAAAGRVAFAADDRSGVLRVFSRRAERELSVRVIHREVIEGVFGLDANAVRNGAIEYPKSTLQTARDLRRGRGSVALYLNPLTADDVFRVTGAGEVLPQKSTFFYPKLPTGLVFRRLESDAEGAV